MNNSRWQNLISAFNKIPVLPVGEFPAWHISFVATGEISHVSDGLAAILDKGIRFKTDVNWFTPDESEIALSADEREFLIRNRMSVLWLLQMEALREKGMFNYPNAVLEFNLKYLQKFTAACNTRSPLTFEQHAVKVLHRVTRAWYIVFCSNYKQTELKPDEKYSRIIQFERP